MTVGLALQLFAAVGGLAGLGSLINLFINRKKVTAEAADIEQNISDKVLKNIAADNDLLRTERTALQISVSEMRNEINQLTVRVNKYEVDQWETRMLVVRLIDWAKTTYIQVSAAGIEKVSEPPVKELEEKFRNYTTT